MAKKKHAKAKVYEDIKPVEPTKPFRLLDLPPELWSKIGKLATLDAPHCWEFDITAVKQPPRQKRLEYPSRPSVPSAVSPPKTQQPPITRTCKVIREELLPFYYQNPVSMDIGDIGTHSWSVGKYLRAIGPENRRAIGRSLVWVPNNHCRKP